MSERTALICRRRSDQGVPPVKSRFGRCDLCRLAVWIAASSPKTDEIFCRQCAADMIEPGDKFAPLTKRQIADIRKAMQQ